MDHQSGNGFVSCFFFLSMDLRLIHTFCYASLILNGVTA